MNDDFFRVHVTGRIGGEEFSASNTVRGGDVARHGATTFMFVLRMLATLATEYPPPRACEVAADLISWDHDGVGKWPQAEAPIAGVVAALMSDDLAAFDAAVAALRPLFTVVAN